MSNYIIKKMETEDETNGKGYVHWKSWHETYPGLVDSRYMDSITLEKCTSMAAAVVGLAEETFSALGDIASAEKTVANRITAGRE